VTGLRIRASFILKAVGNRRRAAIVAAAALAFFVSTGFYLKTSRATLSAASNTADHASTAGVNPARALELRDAAPATSDFHTAAITKHAANKTSAKAVPPGIAVLAVQQTQLAAQPAVEEAPNTPESFAIATAAANLDSGALKSLLNSAPPANLAAPVSTGFIEGKRLFSPEPIYPSAARGRLGAVRLQLRVAADGSVKQIDILKSDDIVLNDAVRQAVSRWRYAPSMLDGRPIEIEHQITVKFK